MSEGDSVTDGIGSRELAAALEGVRQAIEHVGRGIHELADSMRKLAAKLEGPSSDADGFSGVKAFVQGAVETASKPRTQLSSTTKAKARPHGGPRRASISKGVDDLIKTGWLVKRDQKELVSKLQERYPGANSDNVLHVLKRRLNRTLVRIKAGNRFVWSTIET